MPQPPLFNGGPPSVYAGEATSAPGVFDAASEAVFQGRRRPRRGFSMTSDIARIDRRDDAAANAPARVFTPSAVTNSVRS